MAAVDAAVDVAAVKAVAVADNSTATAKLARRELDSPPSKTVPRYRHLICSDSTKKVHQGWGGDDGDAELKQEEAAATDAIAETGDSWGATASGDWGAAPTGEGEAATTDKPAEDRPPRREREVEEEDNTLTLEQYLAQKKEADLAGVEKKEARQVEADFGDAVLLAKPEEEETYFAGKVRKLLLFCNHFRLFWFPGQAHWQAEG